MLENTAKIFPATSGKKDERVFRISCQLKEEVDPAKLQKALDLCMEDYPMFLCVLRGGLFWNYLEETRLRRQYGKNTVLPAVRSMCGIRKIFSLR